MIHDSKQLTRTLEDFIFTHCTGERSRSEVSDVKADGTVFVKFRSGTVYSAFEFVRRFREALEGTGRRYVQTQDCTVRLALDQFRGAKSELAA